jgi:hypothetical protein
MKKPHPHHLVVVLSLLTTVLFSQALVGQLTARLVESPQLPAPVVSLDSVTVDENALSTIVLSVRNESTNLLTLDGTRSSFVIPDGTAYPLSAFTQSNLGTAILPGGFASGTIGVLFPLQVGHRLKVSLAWTLGALVGSGTWTWEIATAAAPSSEPAAAVSTASPTPSTPAPAATSSAPTTAHEGGGSDYIIGLAAVALGLVLLALIAWGLWSLGSS